MSIRVTNLKLRSLKGILMSKLIYGSANYDRTQKKDINFVICNIADDAAIAKTK